MVLIQLFLPLYDNAGTRFPKESYARVREELVERFGGMTAYAQAPASGLWQEEPGKTVHDQLVVHEVMAEQLDEEWWQGYRAQLEARFRQERLLVRAQAVQLL